MAKAFILSNQTFVREGIIGYLKAAGEIEIAGAVSYSHSDVPAIDNDVEILIVDLCAQQDPTGLVKKMRRVREDAKVIAICPAYATENAVKALDSGAAAILTHECRADELTIAIRKVRAGDNFVQPDIAMEIFKEMRAKEANRAEAEKLRLTVREAQVVRHLKLGKTNRQIGECLDISEKTVKYYVGILKDKFSAANRLEIVLHAQRLSL
jgi:DNA-binding NarL/FixJ family response regulator